MTIFERTFSLAELSAATGVNDQTIKTWLAKGYSVGNRKDAVTGGGGPGQRRAFSFFTVMEFAVVAALQEIGHGTRDLAALFKSGSEFAHIGGGGDVFDLPERLPGLPFHHEHGETIFAASPVRTFEELYAQGRDTYGKLRHHVGCDHFVTINASELFNTVCARLGMHPHDEPHKAHGVTV